jgi:uncharacterized protein YuzE
LTSQISDLLEDASAQITYFPMVDIAYIALVDANADKARRIGSRLARLSSKGDKIRVEYRNHAAVGVEVESASSMLPAAVLLEARVSF